MIKNECHKTHRSSIVPYLRFFYSGINISSSAHNRSMICDADLCFDVQILMVVKKIVSFLKKDGFASGLDQMSMNESVNECAKSTIRWNIVQHNHH